jgi:hypothetical protein
MVGELSALYDIVKSWEVSAVSEQKAGDLKVGIAPIEWGVGVEKDGKRKWSLPETVRQ